MVTVFKFKICSIQMSNGVELTNQLISHTEKKSLFENNMKEPRIRRKLIRSYRLRYNAKRNVRAVRTMDTFTF